MDSNTVPPMTIHAKNVDHGVLNGAI